MALHFETDLYKAVIDLCKAVVPVVLNMPRDVYAAANSYLGLARQASHSHRDRARICNEVRRHGLSVNHQLTKVYP